MGRGGYDTTDASSAGSSAAQYALATHQALVGPQTLPGITIEFDKHVQLMEAKANAEAEAAKANAKTEVCFSDHKIYCVGYH
jgi:hypothetical protein